MRRTGWTISTVLMLTGCHGGLFGSWTGGHESPSRPHDAVGGVNLSGAGGGDWQINRCDVGSDGAVLLSGGDMSKASNVMLNSTSVKDVLRVVLTDPKSVTVNVPGSTPVTFTAAECDVIRAKKDGDVQRLTLSCSKGKQNLSGSVRTLRCGG